MRATGSCSFMAKRFARMAASNKNLPTAGILPPRGAAELEDSQGLAALVQPLSGRFRLTGNPQGHRFAHFNL